MVIFPQVIYGVWVESPLASMIQRQLHVSIVQATAQGFTPSSPHVDYNRQTDI